MLKQTTYLNLYCMKCTQDTLHPWLVLLSIYGMHINYASSQTKNCNRNQYPNKMFIFLNPNFCWDSSTPYYCWKQIFYYKAETANSSPPEDSNITALYMVMCRDTKVLFMCLFGNGLYS